MSKIEIQIRCFSVGYNGRARILKSNIRVSTAFDPNRIKDFPPSKEFIAIWDTGATNSVISRKVIKECGLEPISLVEVHTASRKEISQVFFASIILPNQVIIPQIRVTKGRLAADADVLIGMDVIGKGDFAVTNKGGKTVFSFRLPSIEHIDFVKQAQKTKNSTPAKGN